MKTGNLLILLVMICSFNLYGQIAEPEPVPKIIIEKPKKETKLQTIVEYVLVKHINRDSLFSTPSNYVHSISVGISFDQNGKIDTVYFSKNIAALTAKMLMVNEDFTKKIKALNFTYPAYASQIVILPILFVRPEDQSINKENFLFDISHIWPDQNLMKKSGRSITLLDPLMFNYSKTVN